MAMTTYGRLGVNDTESGDAADDLNNNFKKQNDQTAATNASKTTADTPYAAASGEFVDCDTSSGVLTVNLPAAPQFDGTCVGVALTTAGNDLTVGRNGNTIQGQAADRTLTTVNSFEIYRWNSSAANWGIVDSSGPLFFTGQFGTQALATGAQAGDYVTIQTLHVGNSPPFSVVHTIDTAAADVSRAIQATPAATHGSGTVTSIVGFYALPFLVGAGDVTNMIAFRSGGGLQAGATGTVANSYGFEAKDAFDVSVSATITNQYAYYSEDMTAGTNNFGIYMDGTMVNYFGGNLGVGTTAPDGGGRSIHVFTATAGSVAANANADEFIAEGTTVAGFSCLVGATGTGYWVTGTPTSSVHMEYRQLATNGRHNFLCQGKDVVSFRATTQASDANFLIFSANTTGNPVKIECTGDTNVSIAVTPRALGNLVVDGTIVSSTTYANGNTGTSMTIDWRRQNHQRCNLTGNVTFTFTAPDGPATLYLKVTETAGAPHSITWPTMMNADPGHNMTNGKDTLYVIIYNHGEYWFQDALNEA